MKNKVASLKNKVGVEIAVSISAKLSVCAVRKLASPEGGLIDAGVRRGFVPCYVTIACVFLLFPLGLF